MNENFYFENFGWKIYLYPSFYRTFENLKSSVKSIGQKDPNSLQNHPKAKVLKRIIELIRNEIPSDPAHPRYLLGDALGKKHRHWRRAKFLHRFRLFFRFDSSSKVIVIAWLNDENTLRKEGAKTDPYKIFVNLLKSGNPPDNWDELISTVDDKLDSMSMR